jgi:hypothetical protein
VILPSVDDGARDALQHGRLASGSASTSM